MLLLLKCLSSPYMIYLYVFDNFPYVVFLWNIRWAQLFTLGILYVRYIGRRFNFKFDQVNSNLNRVRQEDFRWLISQVIHIWYRLKFLAILIKVILRKFTKRIKIFRMLYSDVLLTKLVASDLLVKYLWRVHSQLIQTIFRCESSSYNILVYCECLSQS